MPRAAKPAAGIFTGAHKWFMGVITTLAAVMTVLLNARNLGLSSWLGVLEPNLADHAARRIVLTPRADTLRAIGDTAVIVATVTDARGATLAGATLRWRSTDPAVASVDSTGAIVARGLGRATVEVRVREVSATTVVLVRPSPVTLRILGDTSLQLADRDTLPLAARALDARDHAVRGVPIRWRVLDSAVARVDSLGVVRAQRAGRTQIVAVSGELVASATLEVVLTPATAIVARGTDQRAVAGRALADPLVVEVRSRAGQPVPGAVVHAAPEDPDATVDPAQAQTDAEGRVRLRWSLGARAGRQQLVLRVPGIDSALLVHATADPTPGNARLEPATTVLDGVVRTALPAPVVLRLTDSLGTALVGVRLSWRALDGGAVEGTPITDSTGMAEARWTLGPRAGPQRLRVQVGDARFTPAMTLAATARAAAPRTIAVSSRAAAAGTRRIAGVVADPDGNPVAGVEVTLRSTQGRLEPARAVSDSAGRVSAVWHPAARTTSAKRTAAVLTLQAVAHDVRATLRLP